MDKRSPEFWRSIKPGDIVSLSDRRTIEASRKSGQGLGALDYEVRSAERLKELSGQVEWRMLELDVPKEEGRELGLLVKIVDQDMNIAAMEPLDLEPGTREELIDRDCTFLFEPPEDPDDFRPDDLSFTESLPRTLDDDSELIWYRKPQGEIAARVATIPEQSGAEDLVASVVEYGARERFHNGEPIEDDVKGQPDEVMIVEKGTEEGEGYVEFFGLWALGSGDVDVLRK